MKILLLGKDGQVGKELRRTLLPLGHVIAIGRADHNLEDLSGLSHLLNLHHPDMIVNAAAYTAVDKAESDKDAAFLVNANMLQVLADYAKNNNVLLVHYSTDYVFDGQKQEPYIETDTVNPQSVYGASKRAGEEIILNSGCKHLIFRTSWVFSSGGKNFIKTILQLAKERDSLRIVADQYGAPTSAELIADVTALAIASYRQNLPCLPREGGDPSLMRYESHAENGSQSSRGRQQGTQGRPFIAPLQNGIYHLTSAGSTTWHNLACYAVDKALSNGMALKLTSQHIQPISTDEYPLPAKRPVNSRLDISALSSALALHIPDWTVHVDRVITQLTQLERSV